MIAETGAFEVVTQGKGTYEISDEVEEIVRCSGISEGNVTVFVRHTSASLVIMENADPSARRDLEEFFERLVPEDSDYFVHTMEGPDDMPAHVRTALTSVHLSIPFAGGSLLLGTWQGIYLWEHRIHPHQRQVVVHLTGS